MKKTMGVYKAYKKNGTPFYRSSITYKNKHISLGSYENSVDAQLAYQQAGHILRSDRDFSIAALELYFQSGDAAVKDVQKNIAEIVILPFEKVVILMNFRDNGIYFHSPIYMQKSFFYYYLDKNYRLIFDRDDLFYYASHKIMRRGGHLFVADYGMQVSILSRYGIRNFAVAGRDYLFRNGDPTDLRYANIEVINPYHGVSREGDFGKYSYRVRIHINGNYTVGVYPDMKTAAIAYNKAADLCHSYGIQKAFPVNYIEGMSPKTYADVYSAIQPAEKFLNYLQTFPNV